jgi:hypothetical protein
MPDNGTKGMTLVVKTVTRLTLGFIPVWECTGNSVPQVDTARIMSALTQPEQPTSQRIGRDCLDRVDPQAVQELDQHP